MTWLTLKNCVIVECWDSWNLGRLLWSLRRGLECTKSRTNSPPMSASARHIGSSVLSVLIAFVAACASAPTIVKNGNIPREVKIAVIPFRDCTIPGQEDCAGSGNTAGSLYARILASKPGYRVSPVSRPVGATEGLTDDAAIAYAKSRDFEYVVNGEVNDFFRVAPFTFRKERVGLSLRILRVSDGAVIVFQTEKKEAGNLTTPERMIEKLAERFRDAL
jgi:hypothetical protein